MAKLGRNGEMSVPSFSHLLGKLGLKMVLRNDRENGARKRERETRCGIWCEKLAEQNEENRKRKS